MPNPEQKRLPDSDTQSQSKENIPHADQIVVVTNFLYKNYHTLEEGRQRDVGDTDGIRGDLAIQSLTKAVSQDVQFVAADAGSSEDFFSALKRFEDSGLFTLIKADRPGRGLQRRTAFEKATQHSGKKAVVYFQPEKHYLMDYLVEITQPILNDSADIVVPVRNPELFEQSYPDYMRGSELKVNATYNWLMHKAGILSKNENLDWFFGPIVFKNDLEILAMFLKRYEINDSIRSRTGATPNPDMHSNSHYFPIIEALFNKKQVVGVEIPFVYPEDQRENEMSPEKIADFQKRRSEDADAYRLEAIHFLAYLRRDPRSKIREVSGNTE